MASGKLEPGRRANFVTVRFRRVLRRASPRLTRSRVLITRWTEEDGSFIPPWSTARVFGANFQRLKAPGDRIYSRTCDESSDVVVDGDGDGDLVDQRQRQ